MTAITYGASAPSAKAVKAPAAVPAKSLWTRLYDAFVEARMRQAMREVVLHRHLLPADLEAKFSRGSGKINP
jgi:hypothetical protein